MASSRTGAAPLSLNEDLSDPIGATLTATGRSVRRFATNTPDDHLADLQSWTVDGVAASSGEKKQARGLMHAARGWRFLFLLEVFRLYFTLNLFLT